MKYIFSVLLVAVAITSHSQVVYKVGLMGFQNSVEKLDGTISITDSTYSAKFMNEPAQTRKIVNRPVEGTIYVTDGTETSKIYYYPFNGKLKGFVYDYCIKEIIDGRDVIYFCKRL
jgi:hypothetical protein